MITLPVSSSMYQSMISNIQQIHTNGDGTLCITPMQVDKIGHHSALNQITHSNNSITNNMSGNIVAQCNSSFSSVSSNGRNSIGNCQVNSANHMYASATSMPTLMPCDNQINQNGTNNLLELCHVLSQNAQQNHMETLVSANASNNTLSYGNTHGQHFPHNNNDRKSIKIRRTARNQQCPADFNAVTAYSNDDNQLIARNVSHHMIAKSNDISDSNNNVNNDENTITIEPDLKPDQTPAVHLSGESSKSCKSSDPLNVIEFDENKLRTIKMERDTGTV